MSETRRLFEAAAGLSQLLLSCGISHAFYGNFVAAILCNKSHSDEIYCIVGGDGHSHPHAFRRVKDAISKDLQHFKVIHSSWTNRLHVSYRNLIPAIEIEILVAGEIGPRQLDERNVISVQGIPMLSVSEFIRARLRSWSIRRGDRDVEDIQLVMTRYWNRIDINRIPEQEMSEFASAHSEVAPAWTAILRKYGMP